MSANTERVPIIVQRDEVQLQEVSARVVKFEGGNCFLILETPHTRYELTLDAAGVTALICLLNTAQTVPPF